MSTSEDPAPAPSKGGWARFLPLLLIAAALAAALLLGAGEYLSFEQLRARRTELTAYVEAHPVLSVLIFVGVYMLATALSVPGGVFLTLAGGFLFGVWLGGGAVVIGATLGAVLLFLAARSAFGDVLRRRAGPAVARIEDGVRENAFFYLLTLRLLPIAPFWLINLAAGFVRIPLRTYALATLLGIAPASFIYAGIGAGLGSAFDRNESPDLSVIFEPQILLPLLGLAALSLVPVVWKRVRGRKAAA